MKKDKVHEPKNSLDNSVQTNGEETKPVTEPLAEENDLNTQAPTKTQSTKRHISRKKLLVIGLSVILLFGGSAAAFYVNNKNKPVKQSEIASPQSETAPVDNVVGTDTIAQCENKGGTAIKATWTNSRQPLKISFLKPVKPEEVDSEHPEKVNVSNYIKYYKIGTTSTGQNIILFQKFPGFEGEMNGVAVENTNGSYKILTKSSPQIVNTDGTYTVSLLTNASFDKTNYIPELCIKSLVYKGLTLSDEYNGSGSNGTFYNFETSKKNELSTYKEGILYEQIYREDSQIVMINYVLKRRDTLWQLLSAKKLLTYFESKSSYTSYPLITWNDGSANKNVYATMFRGCGSGNAIEYAKNLDGNDLVKIGTGKNGAIVYGFASGSNALFQKYYKDYLEQYTKEYFSDTYKTSLAKLSAANYLKLNPVIVLKDSFGKYQLQVDNRFYSGGGCGKPVVYLYPVKDTNVSVNVGAQILKSDPFYTVNGWQNVLASPNGLLKYNGKTYRSLYWEGYGFGEYPLINQGAVVRQDQVESTLKANLKQQGLNAQESTDFLAFWLPKMPKKPFVRITWLGNASLNRLAPLTISPTPQTVIRVFLDAEGLDQPIDLPAQYFVAPERKGFTVVEWGGLLNGSIQ